MFILNEKTKTILENHTGVPYNQLCSFSLQEEKSLFSKSPLVFSKNKKNGVSGRGNPLLSKKHIRTMSDVDVMLDKILYSKD